ncbi:hypothetical protein CBR_g45999 [Chara braunii]|uniref:Uncharacterized protein n=1 Tax=Chara braunii TaxID=69332 RepID=A0A388M034_CHABU|nr:hypothetical protein CBR_g45999 [Chara braunii]|eukprot:GBG87843.1 hypothetical protein CBR_g45999 [Chara braunii]
MRSGKSTQVHSAKEQAKIDRLLAKKRKEEEEKVKKKEEGLKRKLQEERQQMEKEVQEKESAMKEKERMMMEELKAIEEEEEVEEEGEKLERRSGQQRQEQAESSQMGGIQMCQLEARDWLGQFGFREELPAESELEKEVFLKLLSEEHDEVEKRLLVEERRADLHNRMLLEKRKMFDEKKKMKEEGERLRKLLQEQKGKQVAVEERLTLLIDTLLDTNDQPVVLHQTVNKVEAQQREFVDIWNNFLNNASSQIDSQVRCYVELLDEALCQKLKDPAVLKQLKIGGGIGDRGDDGDNGDRKRKGVKKEKDGETKEARQKMKVKLPWTYNGNKEKNSFH